MNSPVRAFRHVKQAPLMLTRGRGACVYDTQGRRFVDLIMGWGALILGHAHPAVSQVVRRQLATGTLLGLTTPQEAELACAIAEAFPSIEHVRFTTSGTEACMTAVRLARACTGRSKVLSFEGCYHGHSDGLLVKRGSGLATQGLAKSAGVPESIVQETLVVPYNDLETLEDTFRRVGHELACAIVEPIAANMGVVLPDPAWLRRLRALTRDSKSLLVFDEVVTGFRVTDGGAQRLFGVTPDLTVLGKIIGGGFPIGAVGGPRDLMRRLAPEGDVYHAGTFAGHPIAMAAGVATLNELKRAAPYAALEALGQKLAAGLLEAAKRAGILVRVNRLGSMLTVFFSQAPVTDWAGVQRADPARFARFANALRQQGVLIPPAPFEAMFLSTAHPAELIDRVIEAAAKAFALECRSNYFGPRTAHGTARGSYSRQRRQVRLIKLERHEQGQEHAERADATADP